MKKTATLGWALVSVLLVGFLTGCTDHRNASPSVLAQIARSFTLRSVDENGVTVYTRGSANNIRPGYSKFLLDLSKPPMATYREFDANTFIASNWQVIDDKRLILSGLTPQPSGSNGTLEFTINSISATELVLTTATVSQKTGGLTNRYTLTAQ
ncbi:hypothetical protein [Fibrella rubiginis]|uniref:hypothetical protein n=1 Tax=Fibrella rubiginis TaxID=2817060 RepID=UPI001E2BD997|nr:hypothetical protein [Fibrella rubiginis]